MICNDPQAARSRLEGQIKPHLSTWGLRIYHPYQLSILSGWKHRHILVLVMLCGSFSLIALIKSSVRINSSCFSFSALLSPWIFFVLHNNSEFLNYRDGLSTSETPAFAMALWEGILVSSLFELTPSDSLL